MKKYKILKFLILTICLSGIISSCSDYTDGINVDPNNFTTAPGNLLIGQANLAAVRLSESQTSRYCGVWTDQFTGTTLQFVSYDRYIVTSGDFDDDWDDLYVGGLIEANLAEIDGNETGDPILEGVAQIMKAFMFGEAAALWGDIPFTEALDYVSFPNPAYDDQLFVFEQVQELLTAGITNVGDATIDTYGAPVFVDNGATWAEIGHSLKARYYLITKNYANALTEAQLGISSSNNDLLAFHSSADGAENMYYQFEVQQRPEYITAEESYLRELITGETPRVLSTPGDANRALVYFDDTRINVSDEGYFAIDATFPLVNWYETKLIEAEAAYRTGGDALTPFNEVRAELALEYGGSFPSSTSTDETLLNEILEEKYITLIGSLQVFHDARRTDNLIGIPIKNSTTSVLPQRFLYPQSEVNANSSFPGVETLFVETPVNE